MTLSCFVNASVVLSNSSLKHESLFKFVSGNGLVPDGTKPLPEAMLVYHRKMYDNVMFCERIDNFVKQLIKSMKHYSTLAQVMAWCLTAPSHYLSQCWFITGKYVRGKYCITYTYSGLYSHSVNYPRDPCGKWGCPRPCLLRFLRSP